MQRDFKLPDGLGRVLAALLAVVIAAGVTIKLVDNDGDGKPDKIVVHVDGKDADHKRDDKVTVPKAVVDKAEQALTGHQGERDESPLGVPKSVLQKAVDANRNIAQTQTPLATSGASQTVPGCVTRFVVNQSSRNGVRPQLYWLHYTVSANRPGWSDVNAIVALFNRRSFSASSNFVIDAEGHCAYIVPIENKAWTQAGGNPSAISFEVIDTGGESQYLGSAGYRKIASVLNTLKARTGVPLVRGSVRNCVPLRKGIVQHADGGPCSGGHHDINPFSVAAVIAKMRAAGLGGSAAKSSPLTATDRKIIRGAAKPKGTGHSRRYWCHRNDNQRRYIVGAARPPAPPKPGWGIRGRSTRHRALAASKRKRC